MWELVSQYYGLDWLATGASLASIYYVGDFRRKGFAYGMAGSVLWTVFSILVHSLAGTLFNVLMLGMFLRGYLRWRPAVPSAATPVPTANP
jgi:hypothetical protein